MSQLVEEAYFSRSVLEKKAHYHDCHQIILILRGSAAFCINGAVQSAGPGSIVLLSRYENHSITLSSDQYERYVLHISPPGDVHRHRAYSLLSNRPSGFCNILDVSLHMEEFQRLFARITEEHASSDRLSEDMLQLLVTELLILIYRHIPAPSPLDTEDLDLIYCLQRRFEQQFDEPYTLQALAREYGVSESSLSHQFKRITGSSVMGYLLSCRIASAKHDLTRTDLSIGKIVERCGFSDSSNFSRTFKKHSGLSPTQFRRKYRQ